MESIADKGSHRMTARYGVIKNGIALLLILAVFPRGAKPGAQREKNANASEIAAKPADGEMIYYLDIGPKFLTDDGTLTKDVMPDLLHLSPQGYEIWAASIEPTVAQLMGEK